jgi:hypothetical protein
MQFEINFQLDGTMITAPNMIHDITILKILKKSAFNKIIVNSFAHILLPASELYIPPGELPLFGMKMPESINPTLFQELLKSIPFHRMISLSFLYPTINVSVKFSSRHIHIASYNDLFDRT